MNRAVAYLRIPGDYEGNRYALGWSAGGDAVERPDGSTFAFAAEIALFLEGYASVGPLIHFSYVLYLLHRFDTRLLEPDEPGLPRIGPGRELVEKSVSLALAFQKANRPLRNAGALCAWLCQDVPPVVDPPEPADLCTRLSNGSLASELAIRRSATAPLAVQSETPPLTALDFEMRFLNGLKSLTLRRDRLTGFVMAVSPGLTPASASPRRSSRSSRRPWKEPSRRSRAASDWPGPCRWSRSSSAR